jgi:hypothetical protein
MSVKRYQEDVLRHQQEIARLQQEKNREATEAAAQIKNARSIAQRASTQRTLMSRSVEPNSGMARHLEFVFDNDMRQSQWCQEAAEQCQQRIMEIEAKIACEQEQLYEYQNRLLAAQDQENRRRNQAQKRTARSHDQRMKTMSGKLVQHDQLHAVALSAIEKLQQLPEEITVLFFAADPFAHEKLRLDEEVRAIGEMIRESKHRDSVRLESRWAVRPLDILQAINECRPRVVHFSGHGSDQEEIVFKDNAGRVKLVSKEAIVQTMAAASEDIQLVFFNTCYSRGQAEAVVQHVPAAIGMNTSIRDDAARVFSTQFYSAIGFGLSIGKAFQQAKVALLLEGIPEESTPELFVAAGLNIDELVLVQPAAPSGQSHRITRRSSGRQNRRSSA